MQNAEDSFHSETCVRKQEVMESWNAVSRPRYTLIYLFIIKMQGNSNISNYHKTMF